MRLLLINNHSVLNAGDYAILLQTLRVLHAAFPGAEIALTFNDVASARAALPAYTIHPSPLTWAVQENTNGRYRLVSPLRRAAYLAALLVGALVYRLSGATPRVFADARKQALFAEFAHADLVLGCGGGYLYATTRQVSPVGWFTFTILACLIALLLGKPLVLLSQSIGPLHDRFQQRAVAWIVRHAALTFVRERRSLQLLHTFACAGRALLCPDLAFALPGAPAAEARALLDRYIPAHLKPAFRVGMTALNWNAQNYVFGGQSSYEQALLGCIDAITGQDGVVVLFAQSCGPSEGEDDRAVNLRVRAQARCPERVIVLNEVLAPGLLQAAYGCMDYFIGTRMHSVILALNAGVPAMAIGYLSKTSGVLAELGLAEHCYEISTLTAEQLIAGFERLRHASQPDRVQAYLARAQRLNEALPALLRLTVRER